MSEESQIKKFSKIIEIAAELYEDDPEYFIDCFFNMYYQMKKKITVHERCGGNKEAIKVTWSALNMIKYLCEEKKEKIDKAFPLVCNKFNMDHGFLSGILNSFRAFKSAKKTKFKNLI